MAGRRALHFVFKIGERKETIKFYTKVLGMKVLRHEEFEEGCKATCNGPYDGKWSKTMIGYGPEDNHFVIELTYNYGVKSYKLGNDFVGITISAKDIISNSKSNDWPVKEENKRKYVEAPGGYKFYIDEDTSNKSDPVQKVTLSSSNLQNSLNYWKGILGMQTFEEKDNTILLGYSTEQCKLELRQINESVRHEQAFGRIAFSCPTNELPEIEKSIQNAGQKIITPLVSLDTPGKATVSVIILADPDEHEICFVGDEAFRELSQFDPNGENLLNEAMQKDKSDEWFAKKGISKKEI